VGHPIASERTIFFDENMDEPTENNDMFEPQDDTEPQAQDDTEPQAQDDTEPQAQDDTEPQVQDDTEPQAEDDTEEIPGVIPPPHVAAEDRLVRDPNAAFGGVLSGIAHRYNWDTSLVRIAFVILLLISGGLAIPAYLLSWLIIPRATMWPPVISSGRVARPGGFSSRDLGIGVLGLAALVTLGVGAGDAAAIVVPIALIGAGIWLLMQSPRTETAPAGVAVPGAPVYGTTLGADVSPPPLSRPASPPQPQQPVVPRSRSRRVAKFGLFGLLGLIVLLAIAIPLIAFATVFEGDLDFDITSRRVVVEEVIPSVITQDVGELVVDLRSFDFADDPVSAEVLDISLDAGEIEVLLPEDIRVDVVATTDAGDVSVLGRSEEGINAEVVVSEPDPHLILEVELNVGEIDVIRDDDRVVQRNIETEERR